MPYKLICFLFSIRAEPLAITGHLLASHPSSLILFVTSGNDSALKKTLKEIECLQEDVSTINSISNLMTKLSCSHSSLEDSVRELLTGLNRQLNEKQNNDSSLLTLEITITSQ